MSYTKGPWQYQPYNNRIVSLSQWLIEPNEKEQEEGIPQTVISLFGAMGGDDSTADATLMASAPSMLETLEQTYLEIQTLVQKDLNVGRATLAVKTDSMRASLRNQISASTGEDCQQLQERIESLAYNKAKGL